MFDLLSKVSVHPVAIIICSVLCSLLGVWGRNRAILRRVRTIEDEVEHLADRMDRQNKIRGGRASADARLSHMQQAAEIAAAASQKKEIIRLPGRNTA
jgi:hypothetical protein